jgi:C_GCAxxG_C_C family probable redox protein
MEYFEFARIMEEVHSKRVIGFNCAEGVFWGIIETLGLNVPVSCVTGFGGGVAGSGSVCGALCGAIAAVGIYVGRIKPEDNKAKTRCDAMCRSIAKGFINEMGTQVCREILGYMPGTRSKQLSQESDKKYIDPKCKRAVSISIELAIKEIKQDHCKRAQPINQAPLMHMAESE